MGHKISSIDCIYLVIDVIDYSSRKCLRSQAILKTEYQVMKTTSSRYMLDPNHTYTSYDTTSYLAAITASILVEMEFRDVRLSWRKGRRFGEPGDNPRRRGRTSNKLHPDMASLVRYFAENNLFIDRSIIPCPFLKRSGD